MFAPMVAAMPSHSMNRASRSPVTGSPRAAPPTPGHSMQAVAGSLSCPGSSTGSRGYGWRSRAARGADAGELLGDGPQAACELGVMSGSGAADEFGGAAHVRQVAGITMLSMTTSEV
jgi:hypothetical protein